MGLEDKTYMTLYKYDEAGNRTRKVSYKYTGSSPDPEFDLTGDAPPWQQVLDEFYVRDISGKEVAIYSSSSLTQWNIWGLDNVGKINADTTKYYYLKDHLGTIRVVLNSTNQVVSANDYDCWGFAMQNRSYQSGNTIYKFTGKERDNESSYDYFGARYYDSRVATWGSVDPLFEKHIQWTPYNYVLRNPLRLIDPDGRQVDVTNPIYHINKETTSLQLKAIEYNQNLETLSKKAMPYLIVTFNYTRKAAFGIYLNKQFGVVRNIPLISINSPTVLTVLATIAGILHATAPDLNKGEEKQLQEIKEEKEEAHYREVKELYDEYTKKTTDDKNQSSIINQTTPSKAILRITKGFNKVGF